VKLYLNKGKPFSKSKKFLINDSKQVLWRKDEKKKIWKEHEIDYLKRSFFKRTFCIMGQREIKK